MIGPPTIAAGLVVRREEEQPKDTAAGRRTSRLMAPPPGPATTVSSESSGGNDEGAVQRQRSMTDDAEVAQMEKSDITRRSAGDHGACIEKMALPILAVAMRASFGP
jgi:hypothetical protein